MGELTHTDKNGRAKMVDVSNKDETLRTALACGFIIMNKEIIEKVIGLEIKKGDVINAAKIAGINAAKKTWDLIPLCHQIKLTSIDIDFEISKQDNKIMVVSTVKGYDRTGVEMEALTAVSISLLTIYDMCKALSKEMIVGGIQLLKKTGGKSDFSKR